MCVKPFAVRPEATFTMGKEACWNSGIESEYSFFQFFVELTGMAFAHAPVSVSAFLCRFPNFNRICNVFAF